VSVKSNRSVIWAAVLALFVVLPSAVAHGGSVAPAYQVRDKVSQRTTARIQPDKKLNTYQRENLRGYLANQAAFIDTLRIIAIQLQFADSLMGGQTGSLRPEVRDSTWFANELKHVQQYFDAASQGRLTIEYDVTSALYTLPSDMGYYGDDEFEDTRGVELMQDAIALADADIDFSLYHTVMIVHAGAGQETDIFDNSRVQIYTTFFDQPDIDAAFEDSTVAGLLTNDMKGGMPFVVDNFMIVPANSSQDGRIIGSLGLWLFEVGSRLGLLPLFDSTPSGFPDSRGVGDYDVMSYGLFAAEGFVPVFPSAFNRVVAGWIDPLVVETDGDFRLRDMNTATAADTSCLKIPVTESEYYLVVNRAHDTNFDSLFTFGDLDSNRIPNNTDSLAGAEFDFFMTDFTNPFLVKPDPNAGGVLRRFIITGSGIYIWHVDESVIRQTTEAGFLPNDFSSRKGVDLEEADGVQDLDGVADFFSFGSHFDSYRTETNSTFDDDSEPNSKSNSGSPSNISITGFSDADSFMTCTVTISKPFTETRTRWPASGDYQAPTAFDLDGVGPMEVVTLADFGGVYAFNPNGTEFVDNVPDVIEPFIAVANAQWVGTPAVGDIDGGGDEEIIAVDVSIVYAWKGDGSDVADGDNNGSTIGPLYTGGPFAAPPMLVNIDADPQMEIAIVEKQGDSLAVFFIDGTGAVVVPSDPNVLPAWPLKVRGQYCAPLAYGAVGTATRDSEGLVIAFADTNTATYSLLIAPVRVRSGIAFYSNRFSIPANGDLREQFPPVSAPAVGDLNGDGFDEAVFTLADGRAVVLSPASAFDPNSSMVAGAVMTPPSIPSEFRIVELRAANPSAPALGDVDGNGTLEIVVVDDENFYVLENNGRVRTNWPRSKRSNELGDFPGLEFDRMLTSPLIAEVTGGGSMDILFPDADGTLYGFDASGRDIAGFPRLGPSHAGATPSIADLDGDGELSVITLGDIALVQTVDAVSDTIVAANTMVLSIQSLPGSSAQDASFWSTYQHDTSRQGRVTESNPLQTSSQVAEAASFIVYPNPVRGTQVHARIVLNAAAKVNVEIFNLEGESALDKQFSMVNPAGAIGTPFDEVLDVSRLASGVYLMRLSIAGPAGSEEHVKTFAIVR
jgi:M6 family metalloprotease-like protein